MRRRSLSLFSSWLNSTCYFHFHSLLIQFFSHAKFSWVWASKKIHSKWEGLYWFKLTLKKKKFPLLVFSFCVISIAVKFNHKQFCRDEVKGVFYGSIVVLSTFCEFFENALKTKVLVWVEKLRWIKRIYSCLDLM
jgi:hypothetical protein